MLVQIAGQSTTTDSEGRYSFASINVATPAANFSGSPLSGNVPLEVQFTDASSIAAYELNGSKSGYSNYFNDLVVINSGSESVVNFSLSPVLTSAQMRIVLSWGESPSDMDSHLLTPEIEGQNYHVYWSNKGDSSSAPFARLDHDDTSSFGPETTTITQFADGVYHYYVYNYSGSPDITASQAKVQFYNQQGLASTVRIPETGSGRYWYVATINGANGQLTVMNQIQDSAPTTAAKWAMINDPVKERVELAASIDAWNWAFGDGSTSTEKNPSHTYTAAGSFDVGLTITIGDQNYSTTKANYISVNDGEVTAPDMIEASYGPVGEINTWEKFEVVLNGETFGVSEAQMRELLKSVTKMRIRTETRDGQDYGALDSVAVGGRYFSAFTNSSENWSVDGDGTMYWLDGNGVGNGYISITDWASGDWHYAVSPVNWMGDWSDLYGQSIEFWFKSDHTQYAGLVQLFTTDDPRLILSVDQHLVPAGQQTELFLRVNPIVSADLEVNITSSNTSIVESPGALTIPSGSNSISIPIEISPTATSGSEVVFVASSNGYATSRLTIKIKETPKGILYGKVIDATTGEAIANVDLRIAGLIGSTDTDGNYRFEDVPVASPRATFSASPLSGVAPLEVQFRDGSSPAAHELKAEFEGYSDYLNDLVIVVPEAETELNFSMSPELRNAKMRIVLSWASSPEDLDSHLLTPEMDGQSYHIYWSNKGDSTNAPYAVLDRDDTNGFGPETTTITDFRDGTYRYFIYNYSGSPSLQESEAKIQIYGQNGLTNTLRVPEVGNGRYWYVANIDGATGNVQIINDVRDSAPTSSAKAALQELKEFPSFAAHISSWDWTFGDGSSSFDQHPIHTFTQAGNYDISLSIKIDTLVYEIRRSDYINVLTSTDIEEEILLPDRSRLYQNYPNPFNPVTTIRYDLERAGSIRLAVYDLLGQPVQMLKDGYQVAGMHQTSFNAQNLPSGIYFYILQGEDFRFIRKMTLLK